jgi:myo-inositol catabolism protein IolC
MPKKKGHEKDNVVSTDSAFSNKCLDCGAEYIAIRKTYKNGDKVISPPRCGKCQLIYLLGLRMDKAVKTLQGIGNLKARINTHFPTGCAVVLSNLDEEMDKLRDLFNSKTHAKVVSGFNIAKAVKTEIPAQ